MTSDDLHSDQRGSASPSPNHPSQSVPYAAVPSPWDTEETQGVPLQTVASEQADNRVELPDLKGLTPPSPDVSKSPEVLDLEQQVALLRKEEATLRADIDQLRAARSRLQDQLLDAQNSLGRLIQEGLKELEQRRKALQMTVEQLERRQERIRKEMQTTFAGVSQDVAIRVQSFKDYLVGSLQELAASAEELNLPMVVEPLEPVAAAKVSPPRGESMPTKQEFGAIAFQSQAQLIRELIDQYRNQPDYYGPAWQLRRTFEPIHADRVSNWFFTQGGRGAVRTLGSRLQNILVSAAVISILSEIYGDRLRAMVLAQSPERLGEWRRGLQDCLGINRADFGPDRGVVLFEASEALAMSAERTMTDGLMPLIIVDETEEMISLSLLQFPLWLAFAPNPTAPRNYDDY
jgi:vacuolar-type H+-ATPase subunit D/Vma8